VKHQFKLPPALAKSTTKPKLIVFCSVTSHFTIPNQNPPVQTTLYWNPCNDFSFAASGGVCKDSEVCSMYAKLWSMNRSLTSDSDTVKNPVNKVGE